MIKKIITAILILFLSTGCDDSIDITKKNDEYKEIEVCLKSENDRKLLEQLPESKLKYFEIGVYFKDVETEESFRTYLTYEDDFSETVYIPKGEYEIHASCLHDYEKASKTSISEAVINKSCDINKITITINEKAIQSYLKDIAVKKEMLEADINSGKVQYYGQIYTLPSKSLTKKVVPYKRGECLLDGKETYDCGDYRIHNPSKNQKDILDCEVIGINTDDYRITFPKGINTSHDMSYVNEQVGKASKIEGFSMLFPKVFIDEMDNPEITYTVSGTDENTKLIIKMEATDIDSVTSIYYEHR